MRPATRSPISKDQDEVSLACAIYCTSDEDKTRQEFKASSDITAILRSHGVGRLQAQRPLYTTTDFSLDLHGAYQAVASARAGYANMPDHIRAQFPDFTTLMAAVLSGRKLDLTSPSPAATEPAASQAGSGTAAASPEGAR